MSLAGNLKTIAFADILQLLSAGQKTGILEVADAYRTKQVAFRDGNIIYATSANATEDMLGALLLKRGKVSKEDLEKAVVMHKQSGRPLGETLVEMQLFTPEDVGECLRMQVEEVVYNLFSWPEGDFEFMEGAEPTDTPFLVELPTMSVIMEGTRRIDEWLEIEQVMPDDDILLRVANFPSAEEDEITISLDEFRLLPLITGDRTAPQILEMSPIGEFPSYRALYKLIVSGKVESAGQVTHISITGMQDEEEVVFGVIFYLYNNAIFKIDEIVNAVLGEQTPARRKFDDQIDLGESHNILESFPGFEGLGNKNSAFDRFYASMVKIPTPIRLQVLTAALETLLSEKLELVFRFLGRSKYRGAVSAVKKEIAEPLAARRELVKLYQIDKHFYSALSRVDRIVKSAIS